MAQVRDGAPFQVPYLLTDLDAFTGLSNSMFMRAGASILEIYMKVGMLGNDWYNDCHKITATKLNVSYTIIRSDSGEHGSELFVNVDRVLQVLEPIVNKYEAELAGKRLT